MNTKQKSALIISGLIIAGSTVGYATKADWDPTQLETQVAQNTKSIDNHEGRITNLENSQPTPTTPVATPSSTTIVETAPSPTQVAATPVTPSPVTTVTPVNPAPASDPVPSPPQNQPWLTQDVEDLLATIGPAGQNRPAKIQACINQGLNAPYNVPRDQVLHVCNDTALSYYFNY